MQSQQKIFQFICISGEKTLKKHTACSGAVGRPGIIFAALENDYIYSGMAQKLKICW